MSRNSPSIVVAPAALCLAWTLAAGPALAEGPSNWANWRGPDGTGLAPGATPPLEWAADRNVRWKAAIPGSGYASPIVYGDRLYVLTAVATDRLAPGAEAAEAPPPEAEGERGGRGRRAEKPRHIHEFLVLALDRKDGKVIWTTKVREEVPHEGVHPTATFASASPICNGEHLYAFFGSRGLYCLDLTGKVVWDTDFGDMRIRNSFGEGASPALHGDTLVVPWDHEDDSFVVALDRKSGQEKWRVPREEASTWVTPVIVEVKGRVQAIVAGSKASIAYDLGSGEEIWRCSGLTGNVVPTPVVGHGMVYLMSGFRGSALLAVRLESAAGDVSGGEAIAWSLDRGTPYIPSPALSGNHLYFLRSTNGIISRFDAVTGQPHYEGERLEAVPNVYASIVGGGGRIYVCGRDGSVVVLRDGPKLEVLATNTLGEGINATPALSGGELFLRGDKHLFCIAEAAAPASE